MDANFDQLVAAVTQRIQANAFASPWLNTSQAAAYLGYAPRGLDDLRYRKIGPKYTKVSGAIRYHRDDLDAWLNSGRGE